MMFSVIVPTHNGADRIRTALDSVREQSFTDYELIVVCDACEDGTAQIAREYGANVIEVSCRRDGLARNAGLDAATGDWILFLDDDDRFLHEYVFEMLAGTVGKHGEDLLDFSFIWKGMGYKRPSPEHNYVMCWCRCWRREFIGDERFSLMEYHSDNYFYKRMLHKKPGIVYWDMPMYYYNYMRKGSLTERWKRKEIANGKNAIF